MKNICKSCGGMCCSFKSMDISFIGIDEENTFKEELEQHDDLEQLLNQDGTVPDMEWYILDCEDHDALIFDCQYKTEEGLCGNYENRPRMCSEWRCKVINGEMKLEDFKEKYSATEEKEEYIKREVTEEVKEILREL